MPFEGAFGTQPIVGAPADDGRGGLVGFLDDLPPIDDELSVGYLGEPLVRHGPRRDGAGMTVADGDGSTGRPGATATLDRYTVIATFDVRVARRAGR